ncbi:MAG: hypothetical protein JJT94_01795 [Bernardetiaceae bacterium]|nr:hypothetical protein [Bernardetiaceae bacterium]
MAQDYDKIIKENIENLILPIANNLLNLGIEEQNLEEIPDDLQYTIERKPDFLKKVNTLGKSQSYILHIEFQTSDESANMLYRMLFYTAMLMRAYKTDVKQYVIYIGKKKKPNMPVELQTENISFRYNLLTFSQIPYQHFLEAETPEEWILTILANFQDQDADYIVEKIISKIKYSNNETLDKQRYVKQLEVLSQLRGLQHLIIKKITTMAFEYDIKKDLRFIEGVSYGEELGLKRGEERSIIATVLKMLKEKVLDKATIASIFNIKLDYVELLAQAISDKSAREKVVKDLLVREIFNEQEIQELFEG